MFELLYKKGNELLQKLKIETKSVNNNRDIQTSKNFSAIISDELTKRNCKKN